MVIRHHHVHADGCGKVDLLVAGDPTVHGDHQGGALVPQALDGVFGKAVAVLDPPGDIAQALGTAVFQIVQKQHRGGDAVHIVIAENSDGLIVGQRLLDPGHRLAHVPHEHGGDRQRGLPLQCLGSGLGGGDAPGGQHRGQQTGVAGFLQKGSVLF